MTVVVVVKVSEFNMEITHIVTGGCSFTYCQGLENPIKQGWPALLANKLNCPLVNLAVPGNSNQGIHRRMYEYIFNDKSLFDSKPLVIIGWSVPLRREAWHQEKKNAPFAKPGYFTISVDNQDDSTSIKKTYVEHYNDEDHYRTTMLMKASLISLFESNNIPYIMTDMMGSQISIDICNNVESKLFGLNNMLKSNKFFIEPIYKLTRDYEKLPCGHEGPEAQKFTSDYIHDKLHNLYPNLNYVRNKPFYSLSDYLGDRKRYPLWCDFELESDILR